MAKNKTLTGSLLTLETQRKIAKIGMGVSLGIVSLTALKVKGLSKKAHIASGISLIAFSLYHNSLYNNGYIQKLILKKSAEYKKKLKEEKEEE